MHQTSKHSHTRPFASRATTPLAASAAAALQPGAGHQGQGAAHKILLFTLVSKLILTP